MRSVFLKEFDFSKSKVGEEFSVVGPYVFHLIRVIRIKVGETLAILNGSGVICNSEVIEVGKKRVLVKILSFEDQLRPFNLDLALGITRRETFDDIVKMAVELGYQSLIPLVTEFAQKRSVKVGRCDRLIESAMMQSNNPFYLNIDDEIPLGELDYKRYKKVFCFSERPLVDKNLQVEGKVDSSFSGSDKALVIIGPEGGLTVTEMQMLEQLPNLIKIHLPTFLLRCPTAVCAATGYVLSSFIDSDDL